MKVKNLTVKPMGFGATIILPDEVGTLPQGYGKDHPTVKYYLSRNWIKVVGGTNDNGNGGAPAAVNVGVNINNAANEPGAPAESTGGNNGGQNKPIDRMNKEELQALAFERGVEFAETDTKAMLIEKIRAAQSVEG